MRRGRALGAAAVAAAFLMQALPAQAARTPKWAREFVEEAPPVPEEAGRHPQRILLEETVEEVREDGTIMVTYRFASQALSSRAGEVSVGSFQFDETTELRTNKAWHIPSGKGAKRDRRAPVDLAVGTDFLSDSKMRALMVDDVEKGSIVLFEFAARETPYTLPRMHVFSPGYPALKQRYSVEIPEGWRLEWEWLRHPGPPPVTEERVTTWELDDREPPEQEPLGPSTLEQSPALALNLIPPEGAEIEPAAMKDWSEFSSWYEEVSGDRHKATREIQEVAGEVLDEVGDAVLPAAGSAGRYVRDKVRYVAVSLGIGAFQPRPASETFSNLYGDCKDKGTLLRSLLSVKEMESLPVLVNSTERGTLSDRIPAWGFNHYVVAVPVPAGEPVPEAFRHAMLDAGERGRFLIVDTTDEKTSVGYIAASLAGKRALLVDGDRGALVTLPGNDPEAHRVVRSLEGELTPTGSMRLKRESSYFGDFAGWVRASYSQSSADRRRAVERTILGIWPEARIEDYGMEYETEEGAFVETVTSFVPLDDAGGRGPRVAVFPGARNELRRVSLGRREVPVVYDHPRAVRYEVRLTGVPAGVEAPVPAEASGEGWSARAGFALKEGVLEANWELVLDRTRFEPEAFEDLRALWSAVRKTSSATLRLPES